MAPPQGPPAPPLLCPALSQYPANGYYPTDCQGVLQASYIVPLRIRSTTVTTILWTDSFAPLVVNTTQKVYFYSYFGELDVALK